MKLSIIVPCFNEGEGLKEFHQALKKVLETVNTENEILYINDGSTDNTQAVLKEITASDPEAFYMTFSRNFGKEAAVYAGICNVTGDYTAVMDADMQDPPEMLVKMLEILKQGEYDCVAARREDRTGEPPVRSWFARKFYQVFNYISDIKIPDGSRDFRVMTRQMTEAVAAMAEANRFSKGIFEWVGFRTYYIPYENRNRQKGSTKWSFRKLFSYGVGGIIGFSEAPLSFVSWFGILMTAVAVVMLLFVIVRKLIFGDPVAGWASTICVIIFIGGLQLFCLGIIGQYVARIFTETKNRPHYIASESNLKDARMIR